MEVLKNVHRIESKVDDRALYQYLLVGERVILIDTGMNDTPENTIFPYLNEIGLDESSIDFAIITHCDIDHLAGNSSLKKRAKRVLLTAHELDKDLIENPDKLINDRYNVFSKLHKICFSEEQINEMKKILGKGEPLDLIVKGGERIRLANDWYVKILHTPGHSHGHLSIYDEKNKAVFIGDAVQGKTYVTIDGKQAFPPTYYYVNEYLKTLELLKELKPNYLFTSHYPIMRDEQIMEFLKESLEFGKQLELEVVNALKKNKEMTMKEIIKVIHRKLGRWEDEDFIILTLSCPLSGHLAKLEEKGIIESKIKDGLLTYSIRSI